LTGANLSQIVWRTQKGRGPGRSSTHSIDPTATGSTSTSGRDGRFSAFVQVSEAVDLLVFDFAMQLLWGGGFRLVGIFGSTVYTTIEGLHYVLRRVEGRWRIVDLFSRIDPRRQHLDLGP
jgi:hypothetical protein